MPRPKLFALLSGVNDYTPNVGKLHGCLNDVDAYEAWLSERFPADDRSIQILKDSTATRDGIITGFREHLAQAGPHDIALFQFAGHGARWKSASAFHPFYPDGFDEGLVCWDSRREPGKPGSYDFADKELAVLIAEVAQRCPHVVVVLDCCHSGSGTRSADDFSQLAIRMSHQVDTERPLESYIGGYFSRLLEQRQRLETPASRHILLAACERKKQAFEGYDRRGIFSSAMLEQLNRFNGRISYADLFLRVRAIVQRKAMNQTPQFEVFRGFNGQQGFLGATVSNPKQRYFLVNYDRMQKNWTVDFGAIHGFSPVQDKPLEFVIFEQSGVDAEGQSVEQVLGSAVADSVGLSRSTLRLESELPTDRPLLAEISSLPASPMLVAISGDPVAVHRLMSEYQASAESTIALDQDLSTSSGYGVEAAMDPQHGPVFRLHDYSGSRVIQSVRGHDEFAARHVIRSLTQMARWETMRRLQNHHSPVPEQMIPFRFVQQSGTGAIRHSESRIRLMLGEDSVVGTLVTENKTEQQLYSLLLHFSDDYGMTVLDNDEFPPSPNERTLLLDGAPDLELFLEKDGPASTVERFMLIVSSQPIDEFLLGTPEERDPDAANVVMAPLPSGLVEPFKGRKIRTGQNKLPAIDWFTRTIEIELRRSGQRIGPASVVLPGTSVTVKAHPKFSAQLNLQPAQSGRGEGGESDFWRAFLGEEVSLVSLAQARGQQLCVLELANWQNAESLQAEPLEIELDLPLLDNEAIVALTFDGEHVRLAGDCRVNSSGRPSLSIAEMPLDGSGARSVISTLRLYFFKTCFKMSSVNRLRAVNFKKSGAVTLERHSLREKVAGAKRVVVLIHSLLGDGAAMAAEVHPNRQTPLRDVIGGTEADTLYLVWDYEQLSTTLQASAQELDDQLRAIGLSAENDQELIIVGHGLGGLMARWLIEQGGGKKYVDQLIMLGVPNGGAPLGKTGFAVTATKLLITVGINLIPGVAGAASYVLSVLLNLNKVTATIDQLDSDGEFLRQLNGSDDPQVPYTIIAGDIMDIENSNGWLSRLLTKVGQGRLGQMLFDNDGHDLFASVGSCGDVPANRVPAPVKHRVACHHFGYFGASLEKD
ncbi:MAG: caspase family protein [Planctomycetaceae bacterium]|nr:caspase family protein [Planctomycetaceae bacterium]